MKKAFTMMELVFVIVIVGIISAMIAPNFQRNSLREAADQVISHIRYTQHLAMMDDMYGENTSGVDWYKKRWQIVFSLSDNHANNKPSYSIFKDKNADGTINKSELAKNNLDTTKYMTGGLITNATLDITDLSTFVGTKALNLGEKYGVTNITLSSSCSTGTKIAFDYLGRPLKGPFTSYTSSYPSSKLITQTCSISLTDGSKTLTIAIEPETGYAHIL